MTTRLALAATTCTAIPIQVILAYLRWKKAIRLELTTWRNGAGLTAMFLVFALWLIQTARWCVCGPLANSLFHHQPTPSSKPPAKIETAYHRADAAIQNLINEVAA
jgi:hypothetical protein